MLSGYNGSEIFHLSSDALLSEFGHQEGARLVSQLKLMKTTAGVGHITNLSLVMFYSTLSCTASSFLSEINQLFSMAVLLCNM